MTYQSRIKYISIFLIIATFVSMAYLRMNAPKVYEGVGEGFEGTLNVKVTAYRNGKNEIRITDIQVEHGDTDAIAGPAIAVLVERIKQKQNLEVELVAGASYTSGGILEAVANAISKIPQK